MKGHWIEFNKPDTFGICQWWVRCDNPKCKHEQRNSSNFCPRCGADMRETQNQTNADRIRSMDNMELAEFLLEICDCGFLNGEGHICEVCNGCKFDFCNKSVEELKKWLESEVNKC